MHPINRRLLLKAIGSTGLVSSVADAAQEFSANASEVVQEAAATPPQPEKPKDSIKFAVIGLDHNHILGITAAVQRGGGELVSVYSTNQEGLADFHKRFGNVKLARSEDEILNDPSIQLIAGASIPDERAPLGIRVMARQRLSRR